MRMLILTSTTFLLTSCDLVEDAPNRVELTKRINDLQNSILQLEIELERPKLEALIKEYKDLGGFWSVWIDTHNPKKIAVKRAIGHIELTPEEFRVRHILPLYEAAYRDSTHCKDKE
jgi:hypothetical protein